MATLPVRDAGLNGCCLETLERYSGTERAGTTLMCTDCRKTMQVKKGYWMWKPVDSTGLDTMWGTEREFRGQSVPGPVRNGRRVRARPYPRPPGMAP